MKITERQDALNTLVIAALLHESNSAVLKCAERLKEYVSRSTVKSLLDPLIKSDTPRRIILDNTVDKPVHLLVGVATHNGIEYDILVKCYGKRIYETSEVLSGVVTHLSKMGSPHGEVEINFVHSYWRVMNSIVISYSTGKDFINIAEIAA